MESKYQVIHFNEEDKAKVRNNVGDDVTRKESIAAIKEWCSKQPHFVFKDLDEIIIEKLYIISNGSLEGTKNKIDKLFAMRGIMSELALNRTVDEFDGLLEVVNFIPLTKPNPGDSTRVIVTNFATDKLRDFTALGFFRYAFLIGDFRLTTDYIFDERYIVDLSNTSLSLLGKLNPVVLKKSEILSTEGYGTKIKGIHIINAPTFVDQLIFILKQSLKEKVASRIFVHKSYEDLHKHISKSILPKDYGGDDQSLSKFAAQWKDSLRSEHFAKYLKHFETLITNESLRRTGEVKNEYMGLQGSFRKLNFD